MIGKRISLVILTTYMVFHVHASQSSTKIKKRQTECSGVRDCEDDQWCLDGTCQNPCDTGMDCESWSRDGHCVAQHKTGTCMFHSGVVAETFFNDAEIPDLNQGANPEGADCSATTDCAPHLYCHTNNRCTNPCSKLVVCTSSGDNNPGVLVAKESGQERSAKHHCVVRNYILKCV